MKIAAVALAIPTLAIGLAIPAQAEDSADRYVRLLHEHGIIYKLGDPALVSYGIAVCDDIGRGHRTDDMVIDLQRQSNMSGYNSGYVVGAAVGAFCPDLLAQAFSTAGGLIGM